MKWTWGAHNKSNPFYANHLWIHFFFLSVSTWSLFTFFFFIVLRFSAFRFLCAINWTEWRMRCVIVRIFGRSFTRLRVHLVTRRLAVNHTFSHEILTTTTFVFTLRWRSGRPPPSVRAYFADRRAPFGMSIGLLMMHFFCFIFITSLAFIILLFISFAAAVQNRVHSWVKEIILLFVHCLMRGAFFFQMSFFFTFIVPLCPLSFASLHKCLINNGSKEMVRVRGASVFFRMWEIISFSPPFRCAFRSRTHRIFSETCE